MATTRVTEETLVRWEAILRAVGFAASDLLRASDWRLNIRLLLERLGTATQVHRIYVFENARGDADQLLASQRFEWVAPGIAPQIANPDLQNVPFVTAGFGRWAELLPRGEAIMGDVHELPPAERELLEPQGIRSVLVLPIFVGDAWWGFIGFDDCARERVWSVGELEALRTAAGALGAAMLRRRTEEALRLSEDQLRQSQKMEAVGQLAGGVAHDFNNLLTVIRGNADLMLADLNASDPRRAEVLEIRDAATRAAALTQQLLAFSRRQVLQPKVIAVNDVMMGLVPMLRRLIGEDIRIVTALAPDAGHVLADPRQLEQVVINLAVNARDAMPQGGTLTLETALVDVGPSYRQQRAHQPLGPHVVLAVRDTGTGIDPATQARIFEPFFTTKEPGRGTGLGLSTAYGIIKQSGGWIWCDSAAGAGTLFTVHLPPVEAPPTETEADERSAAWDGHATTIMLVEDDEAVRRLARRVLTNANYTVLEANSGTEALAALDGPGSPVRLVVTDLVMPGMSGRELAGLLQRRRPELRVLYVSGYTTDDVVRRGLLEPGARFLAKPFTPDDLLAAVQGALEP